MTAVSPVYETVPVGGPAQPDYLNAVVLIETTAPSRELLARLHEVEAAFDRVRLVRWGPRTLDIDIITVAGERSYLPGGRPGSALRRCRTRERMSAHSCLSPGMTSTPTPNSLATGRSRSCSSASTRPEFAGQR